MGKTVFCHMGTMKTQCQLHTYTEGYLMFIRILLIFIGLDKSGYQVNIFLISPRKHMLWVLIRSPSPRPSNEYTQHTFSWRNEEKYQY